MNLADTSTVVRIFADFFRCFAIVIGGWWVYWKYIKRRENEWNLKIKITLQVLPCCENYKVLKIFVTLFNLGNVEITPGKKGCQLTVTKLDVKTYENSVVNLDAGERIIKKRDMLKRRNHQKEGYCLEPKGEYNEIECIRVKKGDLLSIQVRFFGKVKGEYITENDVIYIE